MCQSRELPINIDKNGAKKQWSVEMPGKWKVALKKIFDAIVPSEQKQVLESIKSKTCIEKTAESFKIVKCKDGFGFICFDSKLEFVFLL